MHCSCQGLTYFHPFHLDHESSVALHLCTADLLHLAFWAWELGWKPETPFAYVLCIFVLGTFVILCNPQIISDVSHTICTLPAAVLSHEKGKKGRTWGHLEMGGTTREKMFEQMFPANPPLGLGGQTGWHVSEFGTLRPFRYPCQIPVILTALGRFWCAQFSNRAICQALPQLQRQWPAYQVGCLQIWRIRLSSDLFIWPRPWFSEGLWQGAGSSWGFVSTKENNFGAVCGGSKFRDSRQFYDKAIA